MERLSRSTRSLVFLTEDRLVQPRDVLVKMHRGTSLTGAS